jgi:signal transduction histidine kinase
LLLASLALVIVATTASSLLIIRGSLRRQVQTGLEQDLRHSVETFQDLERGRLDALKRENALMADLPSLKALMTSNDPATIADGAVEFWQTSGDDLFALSDANLHVLAAEAQSVSHNQAPELQRALQEALSDPSRHYLLTGGRLFEYSVQPLYFGSQAHGTRLGYVIGGFAIDHAFLAEVGRGAGAEAAFATTGEDPTIVSTLDRASPDFLRSMLASLPSDGRSAIVMAGPERYLAVGKNLTEGLGPPLRLVVLKSFSNADRAEREINRLIFFASLLALAAGSVLMLVLARMVTRPLEQLADGVRALGEGNPRYSLPENGTQEVRYLSRVFAEMRDEIHKKNRALLESERLATIGRMASSVSHDLRHYLAAVYANAEFLASPSLPLAERLEMLEDIRLAVNGTTDMLDSLLIFSRTGKALQRVPTTMNSLAEQAVALVRSHPDAESVTIQLEKSPADTTAALDTKQLERAIFNLLLNACQSARESTDRRQVNISVYSDQDTVGVTILDTGPGVSERIRDSLFDPFVSQGKHKGTGLGLTLASSVAKEHDGEACLVSSQPGATIFRLVVARHLPHNEALQNPSRGVMAS